jgi:hypothetical protein
VASIALTTALGLFVYGFWVETPLAQVERPMTRAAIELALAGTLLHCVAEVVFPAMHSSAVRGAAVHDRETLGV